MRTALLELMLLALAGGVLGAFVVLRRLAFYSHAVGTATFPGLVVAVDRGRMTVRVEGTDAGPVDVLRQPQPRLLRPHRQGQQLERCRLTDPLGQRHFSSSG